MDVQQVKGTVKEWLSMNLSQFPGLQGAHFVGSINSMAEEAFFPPYKDVGMHLIFSAGSPILENHGPFVNLIETEYRGIILEGGYKPVSDYQTPEAILANPEITHHLTVDSLIYDPAGWLQGLQPPIRQEYARRKWVLARIDYERRALEQWRELRPSAQAMDNSGLLETSLLGYHMTFLVSLLCIATLQAPSSANNRLREILSEHHRLDLYDQAMEIAGLGHFTAGQAEQLLAEGGQAFDLAVKVKHTPMPFSHKINPHQRRYFVDACRDLLNTGFLQEAMARILAFYGGSILVILADGPEEVKQIYTAKKYELVEMIGMNTQAARDERFRRTIELDQQFFKLAELLVRDNPAIFD